MGLTCCDGAAQENAARIGKNQFFAGHSVACGTVKAGEAERTALQINV